MVVCSVSSKQGSQEFLGAKTYPNVAVGRKQPRFESYTVGVLEFKKCPLWWTMEKLGGAA